MDSEPLKTRLLAEINLLWRAHAQVGLQGEMQLFSHIAQEPWRARQPGLSFWFSPESTEEAVDFLLEHYNAGTLPNSPLLLNPVVHKLVGDSVYEPLGSGFAWATALSLGIHSMRDDSLERLLSVGALASSFSRGDSERAGLKILAFSTDILKPVGDGRTVEGCRELYDLADISSPRYSGYYLLSGLAYLSTNGLFKHRRFNDIYPPELREDIADVQVQLARIEDAAFCWDSYERHHSLYQKFGPERENVARNLRFFDLVARDTVLFDATGPTRADADEMFEFIVPGLVPRGSVTLLAGAGGTGKSSLAHHLAIMAATDYQAGEEAPKWLGQRVAIEKCGGISIYFSGEDGPPIINARTQLFDPDSRAQRLMFQRTSFDGASFADFLKYLHKIPSVPLMVIDPARKYLTGDEEDAGVVSEFFEAIEEFAILKNTAVLVVHHLQKGAHPQSAREVLDCLRGSQVFIDRPRVVIGMYRDGPYTIVGLAKNNIPPNLGMVTQERVFARDVENLSLVWLPGEKGLRYVELPPEEIEAIKQAGEHE